jgi:hypothetical protein
MLRTALALLSTLQIGARIKDSFERSLRQALVIAVAAVLLIAATVFGLLAAYHALMSLYQFSAMGTAAIMAGGLALVGIIVLAIVPLVGRQPKRAKPGPPVTTGERPALIIGKAMQQVGPVPLIAIAFLAGVLAGRR